MTYAKIAKLIVQHINNGTVDAAQRIYDFNVRAGRSTARLDKAIAAEQAKSK
ncbi:MAG: hypothetical protein R3D03_10250 [Geminicoccaceae bacterium]